MQLEKSTLHFLKDLQKNNNRDWFAENKPTYTKVLQNAKDVFAAIHSKLEMHDEIEKSKMMRIYRDVRFSMHVWHMVISYQEIYKVDIVNQDGFNFISDLNKKYKMISKTYPQSSIHLKARIKILDEIADKWNAGKVRSSGRWMSKIDYDTVLELKKKKRDRDRKFKEEEKLAKEKRNSELKALMKKRENDLKLQRLKDLEEKEETERSRRIHELQRSKLDLINKIKAIDRELPSMKKDLNLIKDRIKEINDNQEQLIKLFEYNNFETS